MKSLLSLLLLLTVSLTAAARSESRLERHPDGSATLVVDGRPYIIIGGETHQVRHVRIGVDELKILHFTLYTY